MKTDLGSDLYWRWAKESNFFAHQHAMGANQSNDSTHSLHYGSRMQHAAIKQHQYQPCVIVF
jgi:hypothetical protein